MLRNTENVCARPDIREQVTQSLLRRPHHVDSPVLAVVDLVVSDDGTTICPDLDSCQGVAIDVVSFDEASAITENINAALVAIKDGVSPMSREESRL